MRALITILCACLLVLIGLDAVARAEAPAPSAAQAAQAAADAHKSKTPFASVPRNTIDPSAANQAAAQAALQDPAFSATAARDRAAQFDAQARALLQSGIDRTQNTLASQSGEDPNVMRMVGQNAAASADKDTPPTYRLFASRSLDAASMKEIVETARDRPDMAVVFRGLLPGEKINHLAKYLVTLAGLSKDGPIPNVVLDPTPFRNSQVTVVPTLEKLDRDGKVIASVRGITNPAWLDEHIARGEHGDLGKFGPVQPVAEEDIAVVLQRELAKRDLKGSAEKSLASFWSRQTVWPLTRATRDRTRAVDPSVVLTDGITAPDGTVLAYPGQRINPMDVMPFNLTVIVIDARDASQLAFAVAMVKRLGSTPVMVLTTAETDWGTYQTHVVALGVPIYLLNQDIISRFGLEHVPSVVVAGSHQTLDVREYAIGTTSVGAIHAHDHPSDR